jgi:hypothetical protein
VESKAQPFEHNARTTIAIATENTGEILIIAGDRRRHSATLKTHLL